MKETVKHYFIRIISYIAIFLVAITFIFFAINILLQKQIDKTFAVASQIDKNLFSRFGLYLENLFTGNFGQIYASEIKHSSSIASLYFFHFKWTILFTLLTFILSLIIGNLLGVYSAFKYNKTSDLLINICISFFASVPLIIIAILSLSISFNVGYPSQFIYDAPLNIISLFVPILITSFSTISLFFLKARKTTKEVLSSNYYHFALSLGFSFKKTFWKIIFKQLLISELQVFVPFYLLLISSSIAIERIFSIPGQSIFISYAFLNAEINLVMFFFVVNLSILLISKFIFALILDYLNPEQKNLTMNNFWFSFKTPKRRFK
ncbi:ABC transporter permease subunit [[Mycoplasma] anseris]|uniref:ABC transporter permease n=1 Tax=[Mycoplasma] anseris TaxID=92400 RepID=A0A2Z4NDP5_9BACT|nr:ABC transporter permease [[Mycoplasma] anseris]AWX69525.1 ABC transporter permease [[Mycoplasma] anseris]